MTDGRSAPAGAADTMPRGERTSGLLDVPPRERPILLVAVLAMAALITVVATGGPTARQTFSTRSDLARLIDRADLNRTLRTTGTANRQTTALVRLPDRPAVLDSYFAAMDYRLNRVREGGSTVPRVYLQQVPTGLADYGPVARKKALFVRLMLPLVLAANESVAATRARVERLAGTLTLGDEPAPADRRWLLQIAERYGLPAETPNSLDLQALLHRVDVVPPSLAIAQSILESGWGSSRFARQGNALFGQRTWDDAAAGLAPKRNDGFKVRAFVSLLQSVRAYLRNLNTSDAYAALRQERARMRANGRRLDSYRLAGTLQRYSEEGAHYIKKLRGLIGHNHLRALDGALLRTQVITQRVIPDPETEEISVALAPEAGS